MNDLIMFVLVINNTNDKMIFSVLQPALRSEDNGKHLLGVEDLLQKHNLLESQINSLGNRVRNLNKRAQPHMKSLHPETQLLQKRLEPLNKDFEKLV
jgi:spectrin beta